MVAFGPGRETGIISLRLVVTSLYTWFLMGHTAALVILTNSADPPHKQLAW